MYKIDQKPYGYHLLFSGYIKTEEMKAWVNDAKICLKTPPAKEFGVFVDMRDLKPLDQETTKIMVEGQALFKAKGMARSVVILNSTIVTLQFRRLAKESGIYEWERYLDASAVNDFEKIGEDWIVRSIDPDKKQ